MLNEVFNSKVWGFFFLHISFKNKGTIPKNTIKKKKIDSKQKKLKGNSKIIINQANLGRWVCNFFLTFQAHGNGKL